ncbi:MAG: hypothetical protein AAF985_10330 [Bacteroidota bacterium]
MEQQFINLINNKIAEHYQEVKSLLLEKGSYQTSVNTQNVILYFTFLEASLEQAYNRVASVAAFIVGDDGQLTNKMYPFALLNEEIKEKVAHQFSLVVGLANTLEVSGIDPEFVSLCEEKMLLEMRQ